MVTDNLKMKGFSFERKKSGTHCQEIVEMR